MVDIAKYMRQMFNVDQAYNAALGLYDRFVDKGTQSAIKQAAAQIPGVGGILRASDAYNQTMDLYNATGRTSAYPAIYSQMPSTSAMMPKSARNAGIKSLKDFYKNF